MSSETELLFKLLILSDVEGEDILLEDLIELIDSVQDRKLLDELKRRFGWMPPRVAFSKLSRDSRWKDALADAARLFLEHYLLSKSQR